MQLLRMLIMLVVAVGLLQRFHRSEGADNEQAGSRNRLLALPVKVTAMRAKAAMISL
jgi:hypothetical protein